MSVAAVHRGRSDAWLAHVQQLTGVTAPESVSADLRLGGEAWHLVSANHRTLARGARLFADRDAAADAAMAAATAAAGMGLRVHQVTRRAQSAYGWYASLGGSPVVTCARWYDSERTRRESIELAMAVIASLAPGRPPAAPGPIVSVLAPIVGLLPPTLSVELAEA